MPLNTSEAYWLDTDLDRVASGGKFRLAMYLHSTGVAGTVPNQDGSLPSGLTELTGNGYSSPVVNDSGVSANTQWNAAVPGDPTTKSGPASGSWSFGTFTASPTTGGAAVTAMAIIDRITRTSVSCTTTNGSSTVQVAGTTVTNADLGRAVGATAVGATPGGGIAIPTGAVIGAIIDSTHFTMYLNGAPVNATNGTNGTAGTASITLGERIVHAFPYFDDTVVTALPNVDTTNGSNIVKFATAVSNPTLYEGAQFTAASGIPAGTVILAMGDGGLYALISKDATATASGVTGAQATGKVVAKTYSANDNPVIDTTKPLVIKTGAPKDPF